MDASLAAEQQRILASDWGGGKSPFGTSWSKFMMWIFIISDALTFCRILNCLWLHAQHQPRMAEADPSLQHGSDYLHDVHADLVERNHGHGGRRSTRPEPTAGRSVPRADDYWWIHFFGLPGLRVDTLDRGRSAPDHESMGRAAIRRELLRDYWISRFSRLQRRNDSRSCGDSSAHGKVFR